MTASSCDSLCGSATHTAVDRSVCPAVYPLTDLNMCVEGPSLLGSPPESGRLPSCIEIATKYAGALCTQTLNFNIAGANYKPAYVSLPALKVGLGARLYKI